MESSRAAVSSESARSRRLLELSAASCLLLARVVAVPASRIWRDWIAILCLFWLAAVLKSGSRAWPWICAATIGYLLALYASGQVPLLLMRLGLEGG